MFLLALLSFRSSNDSESFIFIIRIRSFIANISVYLVNFGNFVYPLGVLYVSCHFKIQNFDMFKSDKTIINFSLNNFFFLLDGCAIFYCKTRQILPMKDFYF